MVRIPSSGLGLKWATAGGLQPCFLSIAGFGGSRKTKLGALMHGVLHKHERASMSKHARHMYHAKIHVYAHTACGTIPAAGVSAGMLSQQLIPEG